MTFYELFDQLLFQEQQPYFKTTGLITADRINMTLKCAVTMSNEYQELLISDSPKINLVRNAEKNQGKSQNLSFIKFYF